ncbi:MAG: hypothetical protein EOP91_00905 [Lysobacteraceae bacterium]|nr:MAG: hypothetical protein EOP91_00905 [Xanthomonadaceae bacterium]
MLVWSYVGLSIAAFGWILLTGTDFSNDDLDFFMYLHRGDLLQLMLTPLNEHWVPFHRLSSWLVYRPGAMRLEVAVVILLAFHLMAVVYLRATLRRVGIGTAADVLTCAYASCAFLLFGLIGFANAQLRVPHVALCMMAIYHYLAWLDGGRPRHLWLAAVAFGLDLCVYQKAVLLPVYMGVAGWLALPQRFRAEPFKAVLLPACLLLVSIAVVVFYKLKIPSGFSLTLPGIIDFEWRMVGMLLAGILGVNADTLTADFSLDRRLLWAALGTWLVAATASIALARGAWKAWAALLLVAALDFLPLTSSNRMFMGEAVIHYYRYYYESIFLVFLLLGLVSVQHVRSPGFRIAPLHARALAVATLAIWAVLQFASLEHARAHNYDFVLGAQVRPYMRSLRASLARIDEARPVFKDSAVPGYMFFMSEPDLSSRIVPLLMPRARFEQDPESYHLVLESGEVVRRTRAPSVARPAAAAAAEATQGPPQQPRQP